MMDPGSLLIAAAPYLAVASAGFSAISSIVGGSQQGAAYDAQAAQQRANAEQARINAGAARTASEAEAQRTEGQNRRKVASAFNQMAASGGDATSGSPLDVMADWATEGALDVAISRWRGTNQGNAYLTQSQNFENEAFYSDRAADEARTSGYVKAGGTLLGGLGTISTTKLKMGK